MEADARAVDEDVDRTKVSRHGPLHLGERVTRPHVGLDGEHWDSDPTESCDGPGVPLGVPRCDRHGAAGLGEGRGDPKPDASVPASHDRHLAYEREPFQYCHDDPFLPAA